MAVRNAKQTMTWDLTSVDGVREYLFDTPFAASGVAKISGGNANFTYRIFLLRPYVVQSGREVSTMVLKHAEAYVANIPDFAFSPARQDYESTALQYALKLTSGFPSIASAPEVFHHDKDNHILFMADCGGDSTTLKALYRTNPPSVAVAKIIGHSFGMFLARLHTSTAGSKGSEIKEYFEQNEECRRICAQMSYGSLLSILGQTDAPGAFDPPIPLLPGQLEQLSELVAAMDKRMMTTSDSDVLAMGDFWPGNMLISFTPQLQCTVVDWEAARPGIAALEIGQFLGEMVTLRAFHPSSASAVDATVTSFLETYREQQVENHASTEDLLDMAWDISTRCGTHLIVVTTFAAWGSSELTRELAVQGLEYIFHAINKDLVWLKKTPIKNFLL